MQLHCSTRSYYRISVEKLVHHGLRLFNSSTFNFVGGSSRADFDFFEKSHSGLILEFSIEFSKVERKKLVDSA